MNLEKITKKLTDVDIKLAVKEIQEWYDKTILTDGVLRNVANQYKEDGLPSEHALQLAEKLILLEAAVRFCKEV